MDLADALRAIQSVGLVATKPNRAEGRADPSMDVRALEISPTGWKDILRIEVLRRQNEATYTVDWVGWHKNGNADLDLPKGDRKYEYEQVEVLDLHAVVKERGIGDLTAGTGEIFNLERPVRRSMDDWFSHETEIDPREVK
ncbi:MAG: hypothetical protein HZA46_12915 [Planctomycetales bacterium]|nr:hypothetical protein [Planctomycetales bacterium]